MKMYIVEVQSLQSLLHCYVSLPECNLCVGIEMQRNILFDFFSPLSQKSIKFNKQQQLKLFGDVNDQNWP